jgi:cytochrome c556
MRRNLAAVVAAAAIVCGLAVHASEKPTEAYQKAMKDLGAANTALRNHVKQIEADGAYPDYNPLDKDAIALKEAFATALDFWTAKKADDAIKQLQAGMKGIADLETAKKDRNYDGIVMAASAIGGTCAGCHTAHRERLPDGSYEIK